MRPARIFSLAFLILIFAFSTLLYAGVPQMINYQGKITTPEGALIDTTIAMIFTIYDDSTSGNVLWTETQPSVVVEKGIFSVLMGSVNSIPDSVFPGDLRYLGLQVGADPEMTSRKSIVSVAYAYKSEHTDTAQYAHTAPAMADADWVINGDTIYHELGKVGIGTTSPETKLHVQDGALTVKSGVVVATAEGGEVKIGSSAFLEFIPEDGLNRLLLLGSEAWGSKIQFRVRDLSGNFHEVFIDREGDFGIGTTSPTQKLDVAGTAQMTGFKMPTGAGLGKILTSDGSGVGTWQPAPGGPGGISGSGTTNYIPKFLSSDTIGNSVIYETGGNVGIGTTTPISKLHIYSDNDTSAVAYIQQQSGTAAPGLHIDAEWPVSGSPHIQLHNAKSSSSQYDPYLLFSTNRNYRRWITGVDISDGQKYEIGLASGISAWPTHLGEADDIYMTIQADGNVGIGTTAPDEELHVQGNIKMVDGNQAAGKVLTSDGSGVGSWQAAAAGGGGWADDGNTVRLETSTDSVGIGTTGPGYKLHVNGSFYSTTVNTGQGNNELFAMNQNVRTSDTPTFAAINTGPGTNELYAMNQNVRTSDNPTFNRVHLNDYGTALGGFHVGGTSDPGTDNLVVDRNVSIGNDLVVHGLAEIDQYLSHYQDPDTYILFTDDQLTLYSGSVNLIRAFEGTQDQVVINESSVDVDFRVESDLDINAFFVRGSDGNVGIGTPIPGYDLHVNGSFYSNTVNTGHGNNELYAMNQNVRDNDNVTFNQVHLSDYGTALGGFHVGGTSDPGTDNLVVDGDVTVVGKLKVHNNNYGIGGVYCGATASSYDGTGVGGYSGAKSKCESTCGDSWAHMCSAEEIVRSRQLGITIPDGWYSAGIFAKSWTDRQLSDCRGWTSALDGLMGPFWDGDPDIMRCNTSNKILCCW